jgi:FMN phosphatase YigB (HAD superfamily)
LIKAIIFDYGNVISEPQDSGCYARMAELSGLSEDFFRSAFWKFRPDFDRGTIRGEEMYLKVLGEAGVAGNTSVLRILAKKLLEEDMNSWSRVSRHVTEWGLTLQATGYKLGILSNMPFDFLELYQDRIELFKKADTAVFSCNIGQIKPEQEIYRTLIGQLGCRAEEIVFFDDIQANVDGALAAGIRAYLWTGLEQGKKDWEKVIAQET